MRVKSARICGVLGRQRHRRGAGRDRARRTDGRRSDGAQDHHQRRRRVPRAHRHAELRRGAAGEKPAKRGHAEPAPAKPPRRRRSAASRAQVVAASAGASPDDLRAGAAAQNSDEAPREATPLRDPGRRRPRAAASATAHLFRLAARREAAAGDSRGHLPARHHRRDGAVPKAALSGAGGDVPVERAGASPSWSGSGAARCWRRRGSKRCGVELGAGAS